MYASGKKGVLFQTGYMKRFNPGFQKIKDVLPQLGELEFVTSAIYISAPEPEITGKVEPTSWKSDAKRAGGGFLNASGSHHLDLMRYFFGDIKTVSCKCRYDNDAGRDYYISASLVTESGVDITMRLGRVDISDLGPSWLPVRGGWNESIEVIGTRGYIKVENPTWQGYEAMRVTKWLNGMPGPDVEYYECNVQWINELSAFVESYRTGKLSEKASTVSAGYRVDLLIAQMLASGAQDGHPIELVYQG